MTARTTRRPSHRGQRFFVHVECPRKENCPRDAGRCRKEQPAVDALEVLGRQDVRRRDFCAVDLPREERRGDGQGVGDGGASSIARRRTFFALALFLVVLLRRILRSVCGVARAERSGGVGKLGHDARPERCTGSEHAVKPRKRIAGRRSQPVTAESFSAAIVIGTKGEACMQVEPKMREGFVREWRGGLGQAIALAGGILEIFDGAALGADVREQLGGVIRRAFRGFRKTNVCAVRDSSRNGWPSYSESSQHACREGSDGTGLWSSDDSRPLTSGSAAFSDR